MLAAYRSVAQRRVGFQFFRRINVSGDFMKRNTYSLLFLSSEFHRNTQQPVILTNPCGEAQGDYAERRAPYAKRTLDSRSRRRKRSTYVENLDLREGITETIDSVCKYACFALLRGGKKKKAERLRCLQRINAFFFFQLICKRD